MRPILYTCPEAPERVRVVGFFFTSRGLGPVRFTGATEAAVRAEMNAFLARQRGDKAPAPSSDLEDLLS